MKVPNPTVPLVDHSWRISREWYVVLVELVEALNKLQEEYEALEARVEALE